MKTELPEELRGLVKWAVALLGEVIRRELGAASFTRIEKLRARMAELRHRSPSRARAALSDTLRELGKLPARERMDVAHSFTLMLELMNACENAYRSYRLRGSAGPEAPDREPPRAIVYVVTAHPTEARSPENIALFHQLQLELSCVLENGPERHESAIRYLLELLWRIPVTREVKPRVEDEADHVYSILLRPETLETILELNRDVAPFYLRSWVGGDKDGHPGVDERTLRASLQLSRARLAEFIDHKARAARRTLGLVPERRAGKIDSLLASVERSTAALRRLRDGDGARVQELRSRLKRLCGEFERVFGTVDPAAAAMLQCLRVFPGLVVPLEVRESSDLVVTATRESAISRMLRAVATVSRGGDPLWYARGFVISMASSLAHVKAAAALERRELGTLAIPIIPLLEQRESLVHAGRLAGEMLGWPPFRKAVETRWRGLFEIMVGYSDSAKEVGVLQSRLEIAEALEGLDAVSRRFGVTPVFFHGSGGSVDRGGGSIEEQTSWWPASALRYYKATIQGEMVERSFASPEIARSQVEKIARTVPRVGKASQRGRLAVESFASQVESQYRETVSDPAFLEVVRLATPYPFLDALQIGSRPTKRTPAEKFSLSSLRAIPWVLCWTQTRVLFPTWWGVGSVWAVSSSSLRAELRKAYMKDPLFRSYVKLLGFTLAKVELPVFMLYLRESKLSARACERASREFSSEYVRALRFMHELTGERALLWFRPWLGASIRLRSPMIHPLNVLQLLAFRDQDPALIRETVTGISSGMMTTG